MKNDTEVKQNTQAKEVTGYSVFGYFPTWLGNYGPDKIIFKDVTDVALFHGKIVSEQDIRLPSNYVSQTKSFVELLHKENKRVFITFLGQATLATMANIEGAYETLADSINKFCSDNKFDGV
jgi:hypothetical protein